MNVFLSLVMALVVSQTVSANVPAAHESTKRATATAASQTELANVRSQLDAVVERYRKIIVLLDDEASLSDDLRTRCIDGGRKLYREKQQLLAGLTETMLSSVRKAAATQFKDKQPELDLFTDYVTHNQTLRGADALAFVDLADELIATVQESERNAGLKKSSLHVALDNLNEEIKSIQAAYQKEVSRIFSNLETRGKPPKREKWQEYVAFLKGLFSRDQILSEYGREQSEQEGGLRGARHDTRSEIYGYDLPAKTVVLTFDDGPHRRFTEQIMAILDKYKAKAIFFNVGQNLGQVDAQNNAKLGPGAAISKKALESGHLLANHSYSHPDLTKISPEKRNREISDTNALLEKVIGSKPILFRPPYGAKNADILKQVEGQGMRSVLWNIDSMDWADPIPGSVAQRALTQIKKENKGVLLMHDIHKQSVTALPLILDELAKEHYAFLLIGDEQYEAASAQKSTTGRGEGPASRTAAVDEPPRSYYRESWAVVIGINDYQSWPKLRYCVNDANSVEETLMSRFGFKKSNIIKLLNKEATREAIVAALGDKLADPGKVGKEDRVFVFFAGHGATRRLPGGKELGYIVPVDADSEASQARSISMTQLQEFCELIPAKHIYFVIDSCYSGLALTRGGGVLPKSKNYLEEITRRAARQILTAGGADQEVADNGPGGHSIFTWTLLQGLQGLADSDGNGAITASELGAYVSPIVSSLSHQTPAFGNLAGGEGGEFIFESQQESLNETSKQLDEEAIKLSNELERLQKEIAAKRARNEKLRQEVEDQRASLRGNSPAGDQKPQSKAAEAQNHHALGLQYYREKKYDEALKELDLAVKLQPGNATIANNMGFTLYKMSRYEDSINWFKKAINLDEHRAVAYLNLGDAYLKLGKAKEAVQNYDKYVQLSPKAPGVDEVRQRAEELRSKS